MLAYTYTAVINHDLIQNSSWGLELFHTVTYLGTLLGTHFWCWIGPPFRHKQASIFTE